MNADIHESIKKVVHRFFPLIDKTFREIHESFQEYMQRKDKRRVLYVLILALFEKDIHNKAYIPQRLILLFCISLLKNVQFETLHGYNVYGNDRDKLNEIFLIFAYFSSNELTNNFLSATEKQFIGQLLSYSDGQLKTLLYNETPKNQPYLGIMGDFDLYLNSQRFRIDQYKSINDILYDVMSSQRSMYNGIVEFTSIGKNNELNNDNNIANNMTSNALGSADRSESYNNSESSYSTPPSVLDTPLKRIDPNIWDTPKFPVNRKRTSLRDEMRDADSNSEMTSSSVITNEMLDQWVSENDKPSTPADSGLGHNWETNEGEVILKDLFDGKIESLRHEETETVKTFLNDDANLGALANIEITEDMIIHLTTICPYLLGNIFAFMIASKDPRTYHLLDKLVGTGQRITIMVMVRTFLECKKKNLSLSYEFLHTSLTSLLNMMNSDRFRVIETSDQNRTIKLMVSYINTLVTYHADVIAPRFEEILNVLPNFNYIQSVPVVYNAIMEYRQKYEKK